MAFRGKIVMERAQQCSRGAVMLGTATAYNLSGASSHSSQSRRVRRCVVALAIAVGSLCVSVASGQSEQNPVYVDDSPRALAILRSTPQLLRAENGSEAVRSLQSLLDEVPDRVIPAMGWASPAGVNAAADRSMVDPGRWMNEDPDLFVSVRSQVHGALLASPALLARYQRTNEPMARDVLGRGDVETVEARYLLTASGFEAALRVAHDQIERAHFGSAYRTLVQLEHHPERRTDAGGARAASVAKHLATWSASAQAQSLALRWLRESPNAAGPPQLQTWPDGARLQQIGLLHTAHSNVPQIDSQGVAAAIPQEPLNTFTLDWPDRIDVQSGVSPPELRDEAGDVISNNLWVFPSVWNDMLVVNDGIWIRALDRYTLEPLWNTMPSMTPGSSAVDPEQAKAWRNRLDLRLGENIADPTSVAISEGVVVAATGLSEPSAVHRTGDPRVHGLAVATGKVLWSVDVQTVDPVLNATAIRGPVAISDGVAVVTLISAGQGRRVTSRYLLGLDVWTGEKRWVRLVGSEGWVPWQQGRFERVVEATVASDGCVFTTDKLGVIGAFEVSTGRPMWVRQFDTPSQLTFTPRRVWEISMPIVAETTMFTISPDRASLLSLDVQTGTVNTTRPSSVLANPTYLVRVGEYIGGAGAYGIGFLPIEGFASARPRMVEMRDLLGRGAAVLRTTSRGTEWSMLGPTQTGYSLVSPGRTSEAQHVEIDRAGQIIALPDQILSCDGRALHTYLTWPSASALLRERMETSRHDPRPALSFAKFAFLLGEYNEVNGALDTALRAVEAFDGSAKLEAHARAHRAMMELLTLGIDRTSTTQISAVRPPSFELLDQIGSHIERIASSDAQRLGTRFAMGELHEIAHRPDLALRRYHDVLGDVELSDRLFTYNNRTAKASAIATERIRALVASAGRDVYATFDDDASLAWERAQASGDVALYEQTAAQFPASILTPTIWRMVAMFWQDHSDTVLSRARVIDALRNALDASESNIRIDSTEDERAVNDLMESTVHLANEYEHQSRYATALHLAHRIQRAYPAISMLDPMSSRLSSLQAALNPKLSASSRRAHVGDTFATRAQTLSSWTHLRPVIREFGDRATEHVMLISRKEQRIALFGSALEADAAHNGLGATADPIEPLWFRDLGENEPDLLRCDPEAVYVVWPTTNGLSFEAIDAIGGRTRWRSQPFRSLFPRDDAFAQMLVDERGVPRSTDIPSVGVRAFQDVVVSMSDRWLAVSERSGRIVVFNLETGTIAMQVVSPMRIVHDIDIAGDTLALIGRERTPQARENAGPPEVVPSVVYMYDLPTGAIRVEHRTLRGAARWCRVLPSGRVLVATQLELLALDSHITERRSNVVWNIPSTPDEAMIDAWAFADRVALLRDNGTLSLVDADTGTVVNDAVRTDDRIGENIKVRGSEVDGNLVLSSERGVVIVDSDGDTVGIDAIGTSTRALISGEVTDDVVVTAVRSPSVYVDGAGRYRLYMLSSKDGSLLRTQDVLLPQAPSAMSLLDGRILVSSGGSTHVVFTTADASQPE